MFMKTTKRILAFILCVLMATSLIACKTDSAPETTEGKDYSEWAGIVEDPKTWVEEFLALPVASADMTTDELRQLAVAAFRANLTFSWTPNKDISYTYSLQGKKAQVKLPTGIAYSGLMYGTGLTGVGGTVGTIWKVLPYYDKETGVVDVEAMGDKYYGCLTSACSYGALQGWNRVSNSHGIGGMETYNQFDSSIIPVGPYKYETYTYNHNFNTKTASNEIIAANGAEIMFQSYAAMLPADGLFSSSSWHVIMCCSEPVVVKNSDGTINPTESYLYVCEQETKGTRDLLQPILQDNGKYLRTLGCVDNKYTFFDLYNKGYIPFTFKEFLGQDPVEKGEAWLGSQADKLENGQSMTAEELFNKKLCANYVINNIEVTVKDSEGNVLVTYDAGISTTPRTYELANLKDGYNEAKLSPYANGNNTIHLYARLANGELVEAYNTVLKIG
jgi:hypothetical protein